MTTKTSWWFQSLWTIRVRQIGSSSQLLGKSCSSHVPNHQKIILSPSIWNAWNIPSNGFQNQEIPYNLRLWFLTSVSWGGYPVVMRTCCAGKFPKIHRLISQTTIITIPFLLDYRTGIVGCVWKCGIPHFMSFYGENWWWIRRNLPLVI